MHIAPYAPASKKLLAKNRVAGMDCAWNCLLSGMALMVLMFLVAPSVPSIAGALLTQVLAIGVIASVLGIFVAIIALWIPSHDDLIRRRNDPLYEGVHVRRIALICRFFSISLLRATPPPRILHH
ncbi:hypothetical protein [Diaphorobacter nitroreducens]|uniref:hypothetical protein n=1 Tax=Diaphorobacter nitroreducens TaxID=164759 RepID=UPI0028A9CFD3|nr:hypothetical protein [Diaphorobacter nitroreducens]